MVRAVLGVSIANGLALARLYLVGLFCYVFAKTYMGFTLHWGVAAAGGEVVLIKHIKVIGK